MQQSPRTTPIDRIYLHTNEGPETAGGAQNLVNYLQRIDGGYHVVVDDKNTVRAAADDQVVWAEGGDNSRSLSICLIGYAGQSAGDWGDPYSTAELERAAQQVAAWCKQYGVPGVHVQPGVPGEAPTDRGIALHGDDHDPHSAGHTDPGPNFPLASFIARVNTILAPKVNADWKEIALLAQWASDTRKEPLHCGESGWRITVLKQLLAKKGKKYDVGNDSPFYGPKLADVIAVFKHDARIPSKDPCTAGAEVVDHSLGLAKKK